MVPDDFDDIKKLAEQGNAVAQFNLGVMYEKGEGVPKDYKQAAYWYSKAAEQGNAEAQTILGIMYGEGEGVNLIKNRWLVRTTGFQKSQ